MKGTPSNYTINKSVLHDRYTTHTIVVDDMHIPQVHSYGIQQYTTDVSRTSCSCLISWEICQCLMLTYTEHENLNEVQSLLLSTIFFLIIRHV